jgi:hypothetical protein
MAIAPGQELASIDFASMLGGPLIACVNAQAKAAMTTVTFVKEVGFKALPANGGSPTPGVGEPVYVDFQYKKLLPTNDTVISVVVTNGGSGYSADKTTVTISAASGDAGSGAKAKATVNGGIVTAIEMTDMGTGYTKPPTIAINDAASPAGTGATADASLTKGGMVPQNMQLRVPILSMLPVPYLRIDDVTIDFNAKINSMEYDKSDTSLGVDASLEAKAGWGPFSAKLNVSTSYKKNTQQGNSVDRTYSMAVHIHAVQEEMPAGLEKLLGILENEIRSVPAA